MCLITKCKQKVSRFLWSAPSGRGSVCTWSQLQFGWEWVLPVCPKWEPELRSGHRRACDGWTELGLIAFLVFKLLDLGFIVLWGGFRNYFQVELTGACGALKQHVTFFMWSGSRSATAAVQSLDSSAEWWLTVMYLKHSFYSPASTWAKEKLRLKDGQAIKTVQNTVKKIRLWDLLL